MKNKGAIVLCSGGIDSVVTSFYAKKILDYKEIIVLFLNYNQKSLVQERKCAKKCAAALGARFIEIDTSVGKISTSLINVKGTHKKITRKELKNTKDESKKYYVPSRNLIFLSYALSLAESLFIKNNMKHDIFVGFKNEGREHYPDTSVHFLNIMNKVSKISSLSKPKIIAPLIKKDKEDIIRLGMKVGVNFRDTNSCYVSKNKHCGSCLSCMLRKEGFYWANLKDPTDYAK